jgi:MOFRL family
LCAQPPAQKEQQENETLKGLAPEPVPNGAPAYSAAPLPRKLVNQPSPDQQIRIGLRYAWFDHGGPSPVLPALEASASLANNDAYRYFSRLDQLVMRGPTLTNVNDFRAILIRRLNLRAKAIGFSDLETYDERRQQS